MGGAAGAGDDRIAAAALPADRIWASRACGVEGSLARDEASTQTPARLIIPGRTLYRLAAFVCSDKSLRQAVEPAIADFQQEYSIAPRNVWIRARILTGGYAAIAEGIAMCAFPPVASG